MKLAAALFTLFLVAVGSKAATTVLYETGWEVAPASPAWAVGNVVPQNNWHAFPANSAVAQQGVANGSQGAVATPYGTQFHKFIASASATRAIEQDDYVDITTAFADRPVGQNIVKCSIDVYVPASQGAVPCYYGVIAYHGVVAAPWGVAVDPSDRSINICLDGDFGAYTRDAFSYDTWFNVTVTADYANGELTFAVDGEILPELTRTSGDIFISSLTDVDLISLNYFPQAPATRITYSDNFRVTVESIAVPLPRLTITPGAMGEWHISWSADFADWILESTHEIGAPTAQWVEEGVTPNVADGVASVDLPDDPPQTFYRLRKP